MMTAKSAGEPVTASVTLSIMGCAKLKKPPGILLCTLRRLKMPLWIIALIMRPDQPSWDRRITLDGTGKVPVQVQYLNSMRVVLQRVKEARVEVAGSVVGSIRTGLVILLGIAATDRYEDADYLAEKVVNLRIFPDEGQRMNRSLVEVGGELLVVSQFTLYGDCRKGRRPSFDQAAPPEQARNLYDYFVKSLRMRNILVHTGVFQAEMQVHLINDGPVTFVLDSKGVS